MKTSADNRFDELFKERFKDFSENPPVSVLDKIKVSTSGITNPIPFWKNGIFLTSVSVILISGITILLLNSFSKKEHIQNNSTIAQNTVNIKETIKNNNNPELITENNEITVKDKEESNSNKIIIDEKIGIIGANNDNNDNNIVNKEDNNELKNQSNPESNTPHQSSINVEIYTQVTPATCRKSNGKAILTSNVEQINFYWMDINTNEPHSSMDNLHSGNYNIKSVTKDGQISSFIVTIPDSSILRAGFTHYSMSDAIGVPVYFYNKSTQDGISTEDIENMTYKWYFGDGNKSLEFEPEHMYNSMGPFTISLVAINSIGCKDSVTLPPLYISGSSIETSNIFTPNGDGINDVFKPVSEGLKSFNCSIYNTNGKAIYHWNDPSQGWDGKINHGSQLASEGIYFFTMQCIGIDGKVLIKKGFIYLSLE